MGGREIYLLYLVNSLDNACEKEGEWEDKRECHATTTLKFNACKKKSA